VEVAGTLAVNVDVLEVNVVSVSDTLLADAIEAPD
jgi:hypothetical protein